MKPIPLPMAELKNALLGLGKVIPRRMTLPVLAAVKIERTSEGWVAMTATNLDHYATVRLEQPTDGEAATVILPYEELVKTSKACGKNDTLLVQSEGAPSDRSGIITYAVGGQLVDHRCASIEPMEFPPTPRIKGDAIPLPDALRTSIHEALQCASDDPTRYILQGAHVDVSREDGHYIMGTNGRILYSSNSFKLSLSESLTIPMHKFIEWKEFNNDGSWQITLGEREKKKRAKDPEPPPPHIQLTSRRWRFISRQIEGIYPNWRQVVPDPSSWSTRVEFAADTLDSIIQTIERMPCADERNFTIGLEVDGREVEFLARAPGSDTIVKVPVEASAIGRPVTVFLNRVFLNRALRFGLNTLHVIDAVSPVRLSHEGRQMIVMPIRPEIAQPTQPTSSPAGESYCPDAVGPVSSDAEQPAAEEAAQSPDTMKNTTTPPVAPSTNGTNGHEPATEKPALELALEQIETTKTTLRTVREGLNTLAETLKWVQREQKTSDKEVQSCARPWNGSRA